MGHVSETESVQRCGGATSPSPRHVRRLTETRQPSVQRSIRLHCEEGPWSHATLHRQEYNGGTTGKVNVVGGLGWGRGWGGGKEGPWSHATLHRQAHNGGTTGKVNVVGGGGRKVPGHMPHFIDRHIMEELQAR